MIVLIDNYDSFTYNLAQGLGAQGAELRVVRNDRVDVDGVRALEPDGIVLSPGPGTPASAGVCGEIVRRLGRETPMLGVCLGHQVMAAAFGAAVKRAPQPVHGKTTEVRHDDAGVFAGLPQPLVAARYHSLLVDEADLPAELVGVAWSRDDLLMGLRHREWPMHGVQFHPESIATPAGDGLLANFLGLVDAHRRAA